MTYKVAARPALPPCPHLLQRRNVACNDSQGSAFALPTSVQPPLSGASHPFLYPTHRRPLAQGTPEALAYFCRLLDIRKTGRLTPFEVSYFFRAVINKFEEIGEEPNCTVEDVTDEIFDMVKPADPHAITLRDLLECKVGETIVGMLTDVNAFWQYDRREQLMGHGDEEA